MNASKADDEMGFATTASLRRRERDELPVARVGRREHHRPARERGLERLERPRGEAHLARRDRFAAAGRHAREPQELEDPTPQRAVHRRRGTARGDDPCPGQRLDDVPATDGEDRPREHSEQAPGHAQRAPGEAGDERGEHA